MLSIIKRYALGYGLFFAFILIGMTLGGPFILTIAVGLGLLYPDGYPVFPRGAFKIASVASAMISLAIGLWWLGRSTQWLESPMARLHGRLLQSRRMLTIRFVGVLIAWPLFAFILSPWVLLSQALEAGVHWLGLEEGGLRSVLCGIQFVIGVLWLGVVIGCPRPIFEKRPIFWRIVRRCRVIFIDWVLEPSFPRAARRERGRLLGGGQ